MSKKIVTIIGARPQFVKAAALSRVIRSKYMGKLTELLVHTGQHYDPNMSQIFFDELGIPAPDYNLEISGGSHGAMTGRMLEATETVLLREKPDWVLVYGDTNSTLAGALAAAKLHIPVAHVEAGLRSFNTRMPEELNRIVTDKISTLLFCPTDLAVQNLRAEGITSNVHNVGDVMYDIALNSRDKASRESVILQTLSLKPGAFILVTCHRAENTDDSFRLSQILDALNILSREAQIIFPLHPRTRQTIQTQSLANKLDGLTVIEPLSYLDMVALEQNAKVICTDSGGVQKEAFFYGVPCVTMRDETEWVELVTSGWNQLAGADTSRIVNAVRAAAVIERQRPSLYGNGNAAEKIVEFLAI